MTSIIVPKLFANVEMILQTSIAIDWSVSNDFRNCFWKGFSGSASTCKTNMLFSMRNTPCCSFLTSNVTRMLHSGNSNFTECAAAANTFTANYELSRSPGSFIFANYEITRISEIHYFCQLQVIL